MYLIRKYQQQIAIIIGADILCVVLVGTAVVQGIVGNENPVSDLARTTQHPTPNYCPESSPCLAS